MFPWTSLFIDLAILIAVFTVFVVGTVLWKPRIWLHDFPADIQAMAPPKTAEEKRLTKLVAVPFIIIFLGLPIVLALDLKTVLGANFSFLTAWLYGYVLYFGVNLWDLVALDWPGFALIDPQNPPIPGTAGAAGYRDYAFHFYGFLKGSVMSVVFAAFFAGMIMLFT